MELPENLLSVNEKLEVYNEVITLYSNFELTSMLYSCKLILHYSINQ